MKRTRAEFLVALAVSRRKQSRASIPITHGNVSTARSVSLALPNSHAMKCSWAAVCLVVPAGHPGRDSHSWPPQQATTASKTPHTVPMRNLRAVPPATRRVVNWSRGHPLTPLLSLILWPHLPGSPARLRPGSFPS
jgi:hypothetical protein